MNPIIIVLPILSLLMFDLGLTLRVGDFVMIARRPRAVAVGLLGQLVVLPAIALALAWLFHLPPLYFVGLVLIACCPGGSSSNVFSKLAHGDVALSVTLTALSSVITLFTIPLVLALAVGMAGVEGQQAFHLPVGNLLVQNIVLMAVPILLGLALNHWAPNVAARIDRVLSKLAFPALMLLAGIFFVQHRANIIDNIGQLDLAVTPMLLVAIGVAALLAVATRLKTTERRTIVIEVGMQNAAQAIAIASSPFVFNDGVIAIPAIIYALMMNVVLLTYVAILRKK